MMAAEHDTLEVSAIKSRIEEWLDARNDKIDLDVSGELKEQSASIYTLCNGQFNMSIGFSDDGIQHDDSIEKLRSKFNWISLDRLPTPGLDGIPSNWQISPRTPVSSFSEGVTLDKYDSVTQTLYLTVHTRFYAIHGLIPQADPIACCDAPPGTHLQVERNIAGILRVEAKIVFIN